MNDIYTTDHDYDTEEPINMTSDNHDDEELYEHFRITADRGQTPLRIDSFLASQLSGISRNRLQKAAEAGGIRVNGKPVKSSYKVKPADEITILMGRPKYEGHIIPQDIPLDIVFEDDDVLVINKPAGMVVHPGCGNYTGTLVNAIAWHLRDNPDYDPDDPDVGLVHRIDKDTSGLIVAAKTPEAKTALGRQFYDKTTRRLYNALVWGRFDEPCGRIEGNIARHPQDRMQMAVFPPDSGIGKHAVTHYRVIENLGYVTLVECRLETGRTHQIRAHMKHIGHPLFSDERYGGNEILRGTNTVRYRQFIRNCFETCPRQALHARTLGFAHPRTGEQMDFSCPIPEDMALLLDKWRNYMTSSNNKNA